MIYLACDHAGFALKEKVKAALITQGYDVADCGANQITPGDDYPDYISKAAEKVSQNPENAKGIVFGGSGQGEAMTANKFTGVRCALFYGPQAPTEAVDSEGTPSTDPFEIIILTRKHNNANMLSLGARFLTEKEAINAVTLWLNTEFSENDHHIRRLEKLKAYEKK